ncbi:MAG: hypothetical protein J2P18_22760, partial [Nocardia sp.]|nr:hypothetical protein [Nocardia sp.]
MSTHTTRLGLVIGIRVVAAFVVVGSAVTVTALSVRQHDQVASVVVNQAATGKDAAGKAAAPVPGAPPVSGPRGNAAP